MISFPARRPIRLSRRPSAEARAGARYDGWQHHISTLGQWYQPIAARTNPYRHPRPRPSPLFWNVDVN